MWIGKEPGEVTLLYMKQIVKYVEFSSYEEERE